MFFNVSDIKLDYSDVLMVPKRSFLTSRKEVNLERNFTFKYSNLKLDALPVIAANMDGVGTFSMAMVLQKHKIFTAIVKHYSVKDWESAIENGLDLDYAILSVGILQHDLEKLDAIISMAKEKGKEIRIVCLDVANGYTEKFAQTVEHVRKEHPNLVIIAGNVVTSDITCELIMRGADIVKVGIGPGSVCTTRIKTGIGYPQFSAVAECARAAHEAGGHVVADGGCVYPGDVAKAIGVGGDFVMLGGMLAGHEEGEKDINKEGLVDFYGMSSKAAIERHHGALDSYRASEGREVVIRAKGKVDDTLQDILGGLRSACTYVGAKKIKDLPKCATFIRVNRTHNQVFER